MDMIGHHAGDIELDMISFRVELDAVEDDVAFGFAQGTAIMGAEGDCVFAPGALEMREPAFGITRLSCEGSFRRVAGNRTRVACAPQTSGFALEEFDSAIEGPVEGFFFALEC